MERNPRPSDSLDTLAVHGAPNGVRFLGPLSVPLERATTWAVRTAEEHSRLYRSRADRFYQRFGHPTVSEAAARVAALEGGERGLMFGSGMGAVSTTLMALLGPGDHVVVHNEIFPQTQAVFDYLEQRMGVDVSSVDARTVSAVREAIRPRTTMIFVETPSNPLLHVIDIAAQASLARECTATLVVDSTFASPVVQQPISLGATIVLHSGTKYFGGHSDVMCGFAIGNTATMDRLRDTQVLLGTVADPQAAWLILRSLPTLPLRVRRQCETANALATFLAGHQNVKRVSYPWLPEDPGYEVARVQMAGGGGVVSFEPFGSVEAARRLVNGLELIPIATSLGGIHTSAELPYDLDFRDEEVPEWRIRSPALIRLSVGLEDPDDLLADLGQALDRITGTL